MSNYNSTLKAAIEAAITTPANPKITGDILQGYLLQILEAVDAGTLFMGTATPATTPSGQANSCYLATTEGTYTNFTGTDGNAVTLATGEMAVLRTTYVGNNLLYEKIVLPAAPVAEAKILVIGNSFVEDEFSYVPFVLKNIAPSVKLTMGIAHIPGSPLAQHTAYLTGQSETYNGVTYYTDNNVYYKDEDGTITPVAYGYHKSIGGEPWVNVGSQASIDAILQDVQWDIIVFQADVLHGDGDWNTYYAPYVFKIERAVFGKLDYPVKLGWAPTHSCIFEDEYDGNTPPDNADELLFRRWKGRAANAIEMMQQTGFSVLFPSDTAVQNLRYMNMFKYNQNNPVSRFGWLAWDKVGHLQEGIGPLASAYANTIVILNAMGFGYESVFGEQTRPDGEWVLAKGIPSPQGYILNEGTITWYIAGEGAHYDEYCSVAQIAAVNAVKHPYWIVNPDVLADGDRVIYKVGEVAFHSGQPVSDVNIVDDLTTGGANDVLSAEQGKVLNDVFDGAIIVPEYTLSGGNRNGTNTGWDSPDSTRYMHTSPIHVNAGETVYVYNKYTVKYRCLWKTDAEGTTYENISGSSSFSTTYIATEDMYVSADFDLYGGESYIKIQQVGLVKKLFKNE